MLELFLPPLPPISSNERPWDASMSEVHDIWLYNCFIHCMSLLIPPGLPSRHLASRYTWPKNTPLVGILTTMPCGSKTKYVSPSSGSACPSTFMIKWHKIATLWKSNKFDFIFSGCCMHVACELWHGPRFMRLADEEEHACALHCLSLCFRKSQKQFMSLQAMESRQEKGLYKRKFLGLLAADFYNDDVNTTIGVVR